MYPKRSTAFVYGISESHATPDIRDGELEIDGYDLVRKDRESGEYGGVLCYIRSDIKYQRRWDLEIAGLEAIWIEILIVRSRSILVCFSYKPPDSSNHIDKHFTAKFRDMIETATCENKETLLAGDLNCNYLVPNDHTEIKDIIRINGLKQVIEQPTRITKTTKTLIDIITTTDKTRIHASIVFPNSYSDHDLTGIVRKMHVEKFKPRTILTRDFSKYGKEAFKNDLQSVNWTDVLSAGEINSSWNLFKGKLTAVVDRHAPFVERRVRGRDCALLTKEVKDKMNERDYHLRIARETGNEEEWAAYKRLRNEITNLIRHNKANHCRRMLHNNIDSPKVFWKQIKKCYPPKRNRSKCNLFNIDGRYVSDKAKVAGKFCSFFATSGSALQTKAPNIFDKTWKFFKSNNLISKLNPNVNTFKFKVIHIKEVLAVLKSLKTSKSAGPDNLHARLLKDGSEQIAAPLCFLANQSLQNGLFPNSEKCARVIPIYKSGEKSNLDNYRPISVLNVLSKVLEKIVHKQLSEYLETNKLLSDAQYGFRRGRSTKDAVTLFLDHIRSNMDASRCTGTLYLDLCKAFDTVHHGNLLSKLPHYGIKNLELAWLEDYLFNRTEYVCYDGARSQIEHITYGVPQGSILGLLLFVIIINDLLLAMNKCKILIYADDTEIFYSDKSAKVVEDVINHEANLAGKWFTDNNLIMNLKKGKTEFVMYGTSQKLSRQPSCHIEIGGLEINQSSNYEYLGVTLDHHLTLQEQINKIYKKASSRLKLLQRIRPNISPHVAEKIYNAMIRPVLLYCYPMYTSLGDTAKSKLQSIQDRAQRIVAKDSSITLKWVSLEEARKKRIAIDVFKSINGSCTESLKNIFTKFDHGKNTRGNGSLLVLPKVRCESGRKTFPFQGASIYNSLPSDVRNEKYFINFKRKINTLSF